MSDDLAKLNPRIREQEVGIRELRKIKIYPLSFKDQLDMTDLIANTVQEFFIKETMTDLKFAGFIARLLNENLVKIIKLVCDEDPEQVMYDMDNTQTTELIDTIVEINFESLSKNVQSLSKKIKSIFQLERSSQESVNTTDTKDLTHRCMPHVQQVCSA